MDHDMNVQEVMIKINGKIEKLHVSLVFHSRNPATKRYSVNLHSEEKGYQWIQIFCQEELKEAPAKELAEAIKTGKITDLTGYLAEQR